jgi:aspartate kinase
VTRSDAAAATSSAILGAAIKADEVWIYTDVDGVMTRPASRQGVRTRDTLSYREMSSLLARRCCPKTVMPALELSIPIRLEHVQPVASGTPVGAPTATIAC